jgi:hypothetical protein
MEMGNLPALVGTEKQVKYAEDIRTKANPIFSQALNYLKTSMGMNEMGMKLANEVIAEMKRKEEAKFWINLPLNTFDLAIIIKEEMFKKIKERR